MATTSLDLWKHIHKKQVSGTSYNTQRTPSSNTGIIKKFLNIDNNTSHNFNNSTGIPSSRPKQKNFHADRISVSPNARNKRSIPTRTNPKKIGIKSPSPHRSISNNSRKSAHSKSNSTTNTIHVSISKPKQNIATIKKDLQDKKKYSKIAALTSFSSTVNNLSSSRHKKSSTPNNVRRASNNGSITQGQTKKNKTPAPLRKGRSPISTSGMGRISSPKINSATSRPKTRTISITSSIKATKSKPKSPAPHRSVNSKSKSKKLTKLPTNSSGVSNSYNPANTSNISTFKKNKPPFSHHQTKPVLDSMNSSLSNTNKNSSRNFSAFNSNSSNPKPPQSSSTICTVSLSPKGPLVKTISKIAKISRTGFNGVNTTKVNQDSLFVQNINEDLCYIGVCDGHGANGHLVSNYLINSLPQLIEKDIKASSISNPNVLSKIFENNFIKVNSKLSNNVNIDTNFSGSTCCTVLITKENIITANVGDSRAITNEMQLTRDHKASEPDEAKRINRFGGRIEPFRETDGNFVGPKRVWLKKENIPGLAMSRSFGDQIASSVGVICEPEIREHEYTQEDKFIVVASDGLWEYMTNKEVIAITNKFYLKNDAEGACSELYRAAHRKWRENDTCIDDITIIVVFLE